MKRMPIYIFAAFFFPQKKNTTLVFETAIKLNIQDIPIPYVFLNSNHQLNIQDFPLTFCEDMKPLMEAINLAI